MTTVYPPHIVIDEEITISDVHSHQDVTNAGEQFVELYGFPVDASDSPSLPPGVTSTMKDEMNALKDMDDEATYKPDYPSIIVMLLFNFFTSFGIFVIYPTVALYVTSFGGADFIVGLIMGIIFFMNVVGQIIGFRWMFVSYKQPYLVGGSLRIVANILYVMAYPSQSIAVLVIARVIYGLEFTNSIRYVTETTNQRHLNKIMSWRFLATMFGFGSGFLVASLLSYIPDRQLFHVFYFNTYTNPGWVSLFMWIAELVIIAIFFKEPEFLKEQRVQRRLEKQLRESTSIQSLSLSDQQQQQQQQTTQDSSLSSTLPLPPTQQQPSLSKDGLLYQNDANRKISHRRRTSSGMVPSASVQIPPLPSNVQRRGSLYSGGIGAYRLPTSLSILAGSTTSSSRAPSRRFSLVPSIVFNESSLMPWSVADDVGLEDDTEETEQQQNENTTCQEATETPDSDAKIQGTESANASSILKSGRMESLPVIREEHEHDTVVVMATETDKQEKKTADDPGANSSKDMNDNDVFRNMMTVTEENDNRAVEDMLPLCRSVSAGSDQYSASVLSVEGNKKVNMENKGINAQDITESSDKCDDKSSDIENKKDAEGKKTRRKGKSVPCKRLIAASRVEVTTRQLCNLVFILLRLIILAFIETCYVTYIMTVFDKEFAYRRDIIGFILGAIYIAGCLIAFGLGKIIQKRRWAERHALVLCYAFLGSGLVILVKYVRKYALAQLIVGGLLLNVSVLMVGIFEIGLLAKLSPRLFRYRHFKSGRDILILVMTILQIAAKGAGPFLGVSAATIDPNITMIVLMSMYAGGMLSFIFYWKLLVVETTPVVPSCKS